MAKKSGIRVTSGSGNVFADLGFAEPEEELAKDVEIVIKAKPRRRQRGRVRVVEVRA